jgi:hypothetical protein
MLSKFTKFELLVRQRDLKYENYRLTTSVDAVQYVTAFEPWQHRPAASTTKTDFICLGVASSSGSELWFDSLNIVRKPDCRCTPRRLR